MALSDLAVYSDFAYLTKTEVLRQQIELFNAASGGAINMQMQANTGDYNEAAFFAAMNGVVRRRNAYGSGAVAHKKLQHIKDISVKVAAGTPPIDIDPGQFKWIQQNPQIAGVVAGKQIAVEAFADMLNIALGVTRFALSNDGASVNLDVTGAAAAADQLLTFANMNSAKAKFGDQSGEIQCWVSHSKPMHDLYGAALANAQQLFTYGTVNFVRDPFGKLLLMTDSSNLFIAGSPNNYLTLGLVQSAVTIEDNNDFTAAEETKTGDENIQRVYQAEWSYNVGVKGYSWDKAAGGPSPTTAALLTATNWDKYASNIKDLAGVTVRTK